MMEGEVSLFSEKKVYRRSIKEFTPVTLVTEVMSK